ncbi:hydrogenase expression/formation protein HypC [Parafrankia irregularis]|uniref:Hydrogenase expression/formation protein HypC n=1 Tax=Parafrankia irregularis TaxID=795642 RepID=A0A0S4QMN8_9ACTN|nr:MULTISPECIES: HypC/HybG/HupF family hydrogenase formation chaperone [Parafrankia]MBE3200549.1 HypC/HybG/HupF family hydrogenase formation chaperone [Parafrankia sp. CH37]CUU56881.1 hydrogenase expression/formation protein HypC [Parafrankia irregularis]
MCLGIPGRIVATTDVAGLLMGTVDFGGITREVCLAYVADDAAIGAYVIVHVGFAISLVDEAEAHRTLELLRSLGDVLQDELAAQDDPVRPPRHEPSRGPATT